MVYEKVYFFVKKGESSLAVLVRKTGAAALKCCRFICAFANQ